MWTQAWKHQLPCKFKHAKMTYLSQQVRPILLSACLLISGMVIGTMFTHYGYVFENIQVQLDLNVIEVKDGNITNRTSSNYVIHYQANPPHGFVVPNIVHFIWFGKTKQMTFINYLSVLSAQRIQKPDVIMFHCNDLPVGLWWQKLWKEVPLKIVHRDPPEEIHGQKLLHTYHKGDIAKLEILMKYGGIYLDYDVIMVSSMDPLRVFDTTLGKEKPPKFIAGIIVASPNSVFLRIWYESYRNNYRPLDWDYNCARIPYQLYQKRPDLLHIEPHGFTTPDWQDRHLLWNQVIDWSDLYVIHIMQHLSWHDHDPESIKMLDSTFGQVTRFIYYGSPEIIDDKIQKREAT